MTAQEMIKHYDISLHTVWDDSAHYFMPTGKIHYRDAKTEAERAAIGAKEDYSAAIDEMEKKWSDFCDAHWD